MSFGFSAGDFIAAATLIKNIITALRTSSNSEYNELLLELHGLQRALDEIEHLSCSPEQQADLNAVKAAALMCQYRLNVFASKLEKYESLGAGFRKANKPRFGVLRTKLQWGFCMHDEVRDLRAYLIGHMGSLNMRLTTLNLRSTWMLADEFACQSVDNRTYSSPQSAAGGSRQAIANQQPACLDNQTWAQRLTNLVNGYGAQHAEVPIALHLTEDRSLMSQVALIVDMVRRVCIVNTQILDMLTKQQSSTAPPDIRHTWYQQPVKLEDALGIVLPVPSEYNYGMIRAIITERFKNKPGQDKVGCGEYELLDATDTTRILKERDLDILVPGMSIVMAFVICFHEDRLLQRCPRPGGRTQEISRSDTGGRKCRACDIWLDSSRTIIPHPFRIPTYDDGFKQMCTEGKWFKNVVLCKDLPRLPPSADVIGYFVRLLPVDSTPQHDQVDGRRSAHLDFPLAMTTLPAARDCIITTNIIPVEAVKKAIENMADIFPVPVEELREVCASNEGLDALGLDSLVTLEMVYQIRSLGFETLREGCPIDIMHEDAKLWVESFVNSYGTIFDEAYPARVMKGTHFVGQSPNFSGENREAQVLEPHKFRPKDYQF